ncbi:MAG: putative inorganic carbon transporter subunit DabA [Lamprobacter sp.]|uniref:putative inorganic carbon transporter subunit DabA n=1 Tax=Lamprobacter sp. TaxID=3100796 RepID=UPI002B260145|nr:putative inorganic carbon transporter subunit DabA [Lamprobacter sp.]MEA3639539.1 putative inorganic carbon transporter subunit DabA [Lamprobacter sp.]
MVTMAGEVLPFFWPMRNFIHHNPLHGLEHLPFEQAVAEASRLFHARGWLRRNDYQRMLAEGDIDLAVLETLVSDQVDAWLADNIADANILSEADTSANAGDGAESRTGADALLKRLLMAMLTGLDQPSPGDCVPCAEEVLACLRQPVP